MTAATYWRCFHCNATFANNAAGRQGAKRHFGGVDDTPVCKIEEWHYPIAEYVRQLNNELASYRAEDSLIIRAMAGMKMKHEQDIRDAEEAGYAKATADIKKQLVPDAMLEVTWDIIINGRRKVDEVPRPLALSVVDHGGRDRVLR